MSGKLHIGPLSYNKRIFTSEPYTYFLVRLLKYGVILNEDFVRERGNFYKYKKCCIDNYVSLIKQEINPWEYMRKKYGLDSKGIGYVRCEKCRKIRKEE